MTDKKLLFSITKKDFRVDYYRGSGNGGQKKNKTSSACRITHLDSRAVGQSEDERSQLQNKKLAFDRLINSDKFKGWYQIETAKHLGLVADIEKQVDEWMKDENLKVEYIDE